MNLTSFLLLAYVASVCSSEGGVIRDSFIRDNVKPSEYERLTENARRGRTHLAATGSGFFVSKDGYILTNNHVINGAKEVVVVRSGVAYMADVIVRNKELDLGLLKVNLFPRATNGVYVINGIPAMPSLEFARECNVGQVVYAAGFPKTEILGYEPKITRGIVNSLTGFKGSKHMLQMDAGIDSGSSGGPVVDEFGYVVGVSVSGYTGSMSANVNYAINMESVRKFLPREVKASWGVPSRKVAPEKMAQKVIESLVFVLVYNEGACELITSTVTDPSDSVARERATQVRKAILDAKLCKIKKDWINLLDITDRIIDVYGDVGDVGEWNKLARDELGMHLVIIAEADGHDVIAHVKPICGFKNESIECGRPTALFAGQGKRGFDVEAKLTYEDDEWIWAGELKCVYDWHGTKEKRVVLKHIGKK